ncbi:MAG TPA: hypothetical protein VF121_19320 [Thermoanaerobaculia bacterium]|nr:hypothetical protein [Thermoanaerobaculia bacterium]
MFRRAPRPFAPVLAAVLLAAVLAPPVASEIDPALLSGLRLRSIGPAAMSGRVAAVAGAASDPDLLYVGAASGGVWRSTNGGLTWEPFFDRERVASIGDVALFQPNPQIVWVGSGEGNVRNSVSIGRGVFRSLDGGRTWIHLGLEATERIARVVLHPTDPDTAWVAAMGRLWGENAERGVFKTTDGGRTWRKVLYLDERTGAADLAIDPRNPNKLFAAMWEYRRWPWLFRSGGAGSGLFVTHDGGATWRELTPREGLPEGPLGRIGVAVAPSDPRVVYALVEAEEKGVVLRSDDGGRSFQEVSSDPETTERPFYYADLRVDPVWPNRVYSLTSRLRVSDDGGRTFKVLGRSREIHGDHHALWIDPRDPTRLVDGNDGGVGISRDRGETWSFVENLPLAQYYHVAVDMDDPYNVYGGMQDNGSWRGPNTVREDGGVRNQHWQRVGFGDGFDVRPDPADSRAGYSMWQGGNLLRWDLASGATSYVRPPEPAPGAGGELRFNWNAGLAIDPFEPATVYYGSQYLHRSTDRGRTWETISPDLTTDNPEWQKQEESGGLTPDVTGAENFTTIVAVAPSPIERGLLWVGTDDGRLHVTRDGGKSWTSVEKNVRGVPANTWIPHVTPSPHAAATAFAVFDNHRRSDFAPYVFRTDDFGRSWKSLATKELDGYALAIAQDPVDPDLLFLGTEMGLWVSIDGGRRWLRWRHGIPTVSVMDLLVHPRDGDLVVATHGRAAYVLDDLGPLRALDEAALRKPVHLFPIADARPYFLRQASGAGRGGGAGTFRGENEPYGAILTYALDRPGLPHPDEEEEGRRRREERQRHRQEPPPAAAPSPAARLPAEEDVPPAKSEPAPAEVEAEDEEEKTEKEKEPKVEIEVRDAAGKVVRTFKGPARRGVNRAVWDLGSAPFRVPPRPGDPPREEQSGPTVPPGEYRVTVKHGGQEASGTVRVLPAAGAATDEAGWAARWTALETVRGTIERVSGAIERVQAARKDLELVLARLKAEDEAAAAGAAPDDERKQARKALAADGRKLLKDLEALERTLWVPPATRGIRREADALAVIGYAQFDLESSWEAPGPTQRARIERGERAAAEALAAVEKLFTEKVASFRQRVSEAGLTLLGGG